MNAPGRGFGSLPTRPTDSEVRYALDRLGIPLVEIGTKPDISSPAQAKEADERIGMLLRSTRKVKWGLGTIHQDVNVSIAEGARRTQGRPEFG